VPARSSTLRSNALSRYLGGDEQVFTPQAPGGLARFAVLIRVLPCDIAKIAACIAPDISTEP
jgi:hypothetical protein